MEDFRCRCHIGFKRQSHRVDISLPKFVLEKYCLTVLVSSNYVGRDGLGLVKIFRAYGKLVLAKGKSPFFAYLFSVSKLHSRYRGQITQQSRVGAEI